ncbi:UDP-glucosyltransferase 2-like [Bradysia coprophila]|uniref:UDP-glucosyltransferase 2-like n=1 Tax=Bradysia coprophila TaxID=38358 RepID=UPI00187DD38F|nr:UDP-glucosyltransferase 2-like [Bradysia coprophila]
MFSDVFWLMIAIFVTLTINNANSANILCLMGTPSSSHHIWNKSIMRALADRGNNLTILTVEIERSTKNMHFIHMENVYDAIYEQFTSDENNDLTNKHAYKTITLLYRLYSFAGRQIVETAGAKQLLDYPIDFQFDAIIHDFTQSPVLLGFVHRFGYPPLISVSPYGIPPYTYALAQVPMFPSYTPHAIGTFTNQMGFYERIRNWSYYFYDWVYRRFVHMANENRKAKKLFGALSPSLESIESMTELVLVNIDFSFDYPQVLPPNVIPVAGLQVNRTEKPDQSVDLFLKKSTRGAIYFSLGSAVQTSSNGALIRTFLEAVRQLKEFNFILQLEVQERSSFPPNVLVREWLPQNRILAHPNTKLFITHGGRLSVQEAIWHGVCMLGVPFRLDHQQNMVKVTQHGIGEYLDVRNITTELLVDTIRTIIESNRYAEQVKVRSKLFKHQPTHPLDRAVFWIENAIVNRGTKHLSLTNFELNFFQIYMFDASAFFLLICLAFTFMMVRHIHFGNVDSRKKSESNTIAVPHDINKTEKIE